MRSRAGAFRVRPFLFWHVLARPIPSAKPQNAEGGMAGRTHTRDNVDGPP